MAIITAVVAIFATIRFFLDIKVISQTQLAEMVGVSRNTVSSIETGQFHPTANLALLLCIALDKKFEDLFYFDKRFSLCKTNPRIVHFVLSGIFLFMWISWFLFSDKITYITRTYTQVQKKFLYDNTHFIFFSCHTKRLIT